MYQISQPDLTKSIKKINDEYPIVIPKELPENFIQKYYGKGSWKPDFWYFAPIKTAQPLKSYFYPPIQKAAVYPNPGKSAEQFTPLVIIGSKACDLHALRIIDKVYKDCEYPEPYYLKTRDQHILISMDCLEAGEYCYCTLMNCQPYPTTEFDINLTKLEQQYVLEIGSDKGQQIFEKYFTSIKKASIGLLKKREKKRADLEEEIKDKNKEFKFYQSHQKSIEKHLNSKEWADLGKTCVECGICTQICPTCYCFLLIDQAVEDKFERIKVWDSCFFAGYSRMAGGLTPRLSLSERFKNRFYHKFDSFVLNFGIEACTGCGRCVEGCMGSIDLRKVLLELEKRVVLKETLELD